MSTTSIAIPPKRATSALELFLSVFNIEFSEISATELQRPGFFNTFLQITDELDKPLFDVVFSLSEKGFNFMRESLFMVYPEMLEESDAGLYDMLGEILNIFAGNVINDILGEDIYLLTTPEISGGAKKTMQMLDGTIIKYGISKPKSEELYFIIKPS